MYAFEYHGINTKNDAQTIFHISNIIRQDLKSNEKLHKLPISNARHILHSSHLLLFGVLSHHRESKKDKNILA